jgi:hypothetical protein
LENVVNDITFAFIAVYGIFFSQPKWILEMIAISIAGFQKRWLLSPFLSLFIAKDRENLGIGMENCQRDGYFGSLLYSVCSNPNSVVLVIVSGIIISKGA